jgi:hypothetical protein
MGTTFDFYYLQIDSRDPLIAFGLFRMMQLEKGTTLRKDRYCVKLNLLLRECVCFGGRGGKTVYFPTLNE